MRDGPRWFPQDFSCPAVLRCRLGWALTSLTRLSRSAAPLSSGFCCPGLRRIAGPTTPGGALRHPRFGLLRVRSPLLAESLLFSLPAGTEMFQFPAFAPASAGDGIAPAGFPHSEIRASTGICPLTRLFAAYHVLLRLREPQASPMRPSSFSFYFRLCARRSLRFDLRSLLLLLTQSVARLFHLRFHHVNVLCVENNGFEPLTPCLQSRCSSQLS